MAATDRKMAGMEASRDQELRAMQAVFDQRLSTLERAIQAGAAPVAVKF